jgi:deoxycytidine triphosphate deaminase
VASVSSELLPEDISQPACILTDQEIREAVSRGYLIEEHFNIDSAKHSSYEAHFSSAAEILEYAGDRTTHGPHAPVNGMIVIPEGATVIVYSHELFRIPRNVLCRVTVLGQLFTCGISAGNTYIDPGYNGQLYISMTNVSPMTLRLPIGSPLARVEFYRLGTPARFPHPGMTGARDIELEYSKSGELDSASPPIRGSLAPHIEAIREVKAEERYDRRFTAVSYILDSLYKEVRQFQRKTDQLEARVVWHKMALYCVTALTVGTIWVAVTPHVSGNTLIRILRGERLPVLLKFAIPQLVSALALLLTKDVRQLLKDLIRNLARRFDQPENETS